MPSLVGSDGIRQLMLQVTVRPGVPVIYIIYIVVLLFGFVCMGRVVSHSRWVVSWVIQGVVCYVAFKGDVGYVSFKLVVYVSVCRGSFKVDGSMCHSW